MKRFIIAFITLMMITMVSCGQKKTVDSSGSGLGSTFTCDMILLYEDSEYCGKINRTDTRSWEIEFSSPETLAGVKLSFVNDDVTASYKGLDFTVPKKALPVKSVLSNFITVVDEISSQEKMQCVEKDGELVVEGQIDQGEYELVINKKNGTISSFEMKNTNVVIEFENVITGSSNVSVSQTSQTTLAESTVAETTVQ